MLVPAVVSKSGTVHRISGGSFFQYAVRHSKAYLAGDAYAQCGRYIRPAQIVVRDTEVGTWCSDCGHSGLELDDPRLPPWLRRDEERWVAMVEDIRRAVENCFPDRAAGILEELAKRAPIRESRKE